MIHDPGPPHLPAFALIHGITVALWFKDLCRSAFGQTLLRVGYRLLYTVVSCVAAAVAVCLLSQVADRLLWAPPLCLRWLLHSMQLAEYVFGAQAFQRLDTGEFLGCRQVWRYIVKREVAGNLEGLTEQELVTTGVSGIERHPLYVACIVIFTFSPKFTVNCLAITVRTDPYFLFGTFIEERRFLKPFGEKYRVCQEQVPMMVPRLFAGTGRN